ncbi:MAG: serpin family protein [Candidatus Limnocylindria bacterium]
MKSLWVTVLIAALVTSACAPGAQRPPTTATPTLSPHATPTVDPAQIVLRSTAAREPADAEAAQRAAQALEAFAVDMYKQLADEPDNLVFSPYSITAALAMTRAGASGVTADEMDRVLYADIAVDLDRGVNALDQALLAKPGKLPAYYGDPPPDLDIGTANQLWAQQGLPFEKPFLDRLAMHYGAGMEVVDYVRAREEAREKINKWVAERTGDRIPEIIPVGVLDEYSRFVLTNAVYLKATWLREFSRDETKPGPFRRLDGSTVQVPLMHIRETFGHTSGGGYQAVRLGYLGGLSMVVVVPDAGAFDQFERTLDHGRLMTIASDMETTFVVLAMPRWEFRTEVGLNEELSALGMPTAFEPEVADFSGITKAEPLYLQAVLHEAFISVDERGTEAAAATAVIGGATGGPGRSAELTIDRPFIFFIQDDETGAIIFLGRVIDPS